MVASPNRLVYQQDIYSDDVLTLWGTGVLTACHPFLPLTLLVLGRIAQYVQPHTNCASAASSKAIGTISDLQKDVGTSTSKFPPGGVHGQCKRFPIPSQNPKADGISLSPSRATQILQIHRETRKQPHKCPERAAQVPRTWQCSASIG